MKIITIKKNDKKKLYLKELQKLAMPGLDVKKYSGKINISEDALLIQKRLRDEWQ
jgi:hypothetical protein